MTYFNLRKREPEAEPEEVEEEQQEEAEEESEEKKPAKTYGPILTGLLGPGRWLAAHFGFNTAAIVHVLAVFSVFYYGGWTAAGIILVWLLAVGLFTPRGFLEQFAARIEKRTGIHHAAPAETSEEPTEGDSPQPDPQDVLDLVRDVIGDGRGVLLTGLCGPLRAPSTKAVREVLAGADIRVREGVRTGGGNGPGVHRDDLPTPPPPLDGHPGGGVAAGERANTNANSGLRVESREGMTIINDPADRYRTHTLKKP